MSGRNISAKFSEDRKILTVSCINKASTELGVDFEKLISALQKFLDECFTPAWGIPVKLVTAKEKKAWNLTLFDDAADAATEGYHEFTFNAFPHSRVFVHEILANGQKVSVRTCHELAEMIVDPAINLWSSRSGKELCAYEICDPVEEEEFLIDGIAMSDFVFPAYFEPFHRDKSVQFDFLGKVDKPFQILKGGYCILREGNNVFHSFGSEAKKRRFEKETKRMKRSNYRYQSDGRVRISKGPVRKRISA